MAPSGFVAWAPGAAPTSSALGKAADVSTSPVEICNNIALAVDVEQHHNQRCGPVRASEEDGVRTEEKIN